jgi:hypothetical protein
MPPLLESMAQVRFLGDFRRQYTSALSFFDLFSVDPDQLRSLFTRKLTEVIIASHPNLALSSWVS